MEGFQRIDRTHTLLKIRAEECGPHGIYHGVCHQLPKPYESSQVEIPMRMAYPCRNSEMQRCQLSAEPTPTVGPTKGWKAYLGWSMEMRMVMKSTHEGFQCVDLRADVTTCKMPREWKSMA